MLNKIKDNWYDAISNGKKDFWFLSFGIEDFGWETGKIIIDIDMQILLWSIFLVILWNLIVGKREGWMAAGETPTLPVAARTSNGEVMCLMHTLLRVIPIILQIISKKFGGMENSFIFNLNRMNLRTTYNHFHMPNRRMIEGWTKDERRLNGQECDYFVSIGTDLL